MPTKKELEAQIKELKEDNASILANNDDAQTLVKDLQSKIQELKAAVGATERIQQMIKSRYGGWRGSFERSVDTLLGDWERHKR